MPPFPRLAAYVGIGLVAGFLSGLLGVGGGVLIVPALVLLLGFPQKLASGTSLIAVAPISVVGLVSYLIEGHIDWAVGVPLAVGMLLGGVVGSWLLAKLPATVISWIFLIAMVATAIRMFFSDPPAGVPAALEWWQVLLLGVIGLLVGVLSGLVGVGGGVVIVPVLTVGMGIDALVAKGASLVAMIPNAILSSYLNLRRRNADLTAGLAVGLAGCLTTVFGSFVADWIDPRIGSIVFAVFLLLVALQMLLRLVRRPRTQLTQADEPGERSVHDEINPVEIDEEFGEGGRR